jgi:hypothetical protein
MRLLRTQTDDNLELVGLLSQEHANTQLVIHVHGMGGDFFTHRFLDTMRDSYPRKGWDFLQVSTRGQGGVTEFISDRPDQLALSLQDGDFNIPLIMGTFQKLELPTSFLTALFSLSCLADQGGCSAKVEVEISIGECCSLLQIKYLPYSLVDHIGELSRLSERRFETQENQQEPLDEHSSYQKAPDC